MSTRARQRILAVVTGVLLGFPAGWTTGAAQNTPTHFTPSVARVTGH